jgi:hypothetical protein
MQNVYWKVLVAVQPSFTKPRKLLSGGSNVVSRQAEPECAMDLSLIDFVGLLN